MTDTLASSLILDAYREGNLQPVGVSPTTAEQTEALRVLNNLLRALLGHELGENLQDWLYPAPQRTAPVAANYPAQSFARDLSSSQYPYPPINSRLVVKITSAATIYFPEAPNDGSRMAYVGMGSTATLTLNGNGKIIESAATKTIASAAQATPLVWLFRADLGTWKAVAALAASDESLLPLEFDDLLITGLYRRLAPRHGKNPLEGTTERYNEMRTKLRARYRQPTVTISNGADMSPSAQSYQSGGGSGADLLS